MHAPITALYASLCALLLIGLAVRVVLLRFREKVSLGHGDSKKLHLAMRVHANATENLPIALILLFLLEVNGMGPGSIHALGLTLLVARLSHGVGMSLSHHNPARGFGAAATWLLIIVMAILNLLAFA